MVTKWQILISILNIVKICSHKIKPFFQQIHISTKKIYKKKLISIVYFKQMTLPYKIIMQNKKIVKQFLFIPIPKSSYMYSCFTSIFKLPKLYNVNPIAHWRGNNSKFFTKTQFISKH